MKKPPDPCLCLPQPPFCNPHQLLSLPSETLPVFMYEPLAITMLTHYHLDTLSTTPETPTKSGWDRLQCGDEQGVQHLCLSPSVSIIATGRLIVSWTLRSFYLIPGVFVPLYLSSITQVFVAVLHDFIQFMPYSLYLFDLGCIFKKLTHSSLNPQSICPLQRPIQLISEILYAILASHPFSCMEVRLWGVLWTSCQWHLYNSELKMRTQGPSIYLATTCSICSVFSLDLNSARLHYHPYPISPLNPDEFAAGWHDWYVRLILLCCLHNQIHITQIRYCMNCWLCSVNWSCFHRKLYVPVLKLQLDHCNFETMTGSFMFGHFTDFNSLSYALCLNLVSLWACIFYGNRVCWQLDMSSAYENLCMLLHWCVFGSDCMFLLSLIICLLRGNVVFPSRKFPRPSRLRHQNLNIIFDCLTLPFGFVELPFIWSSFALPTFSGLFSVSLWVRDGKSAFRHDFSSKALSTHAFELRTRLSQPFSFSSQHRLLLYAVWDQLWVRLSYAKAELCGCEEHSLQLVSGRWSILQLAFVLIRNCQLFYWMEGLNILLCCIIFCISGLTSLIWLLLCLASEDRRGCITFRNSKALFQTAFGLRTQLLWPRFICLVFSTEPSPSKIFLR